MTPEHIAAIVTERLDTWGSAMIDQHVTPYLALGIGHDHVSGQIHLFICENSKADEILLVLDSVSKSLRLAVAAAGPAMATRQSNQQGHG